MRFTMMINWTVEYHFLKLMGIHQSSEIHKQMIEAKIFLFCQIGIIPLFFSVIFLSFWLWWSLLLLYIWPLPSSAHKHRFSFLCCKSRALHPSWVVHQEEWMDEWIVLCEFFCIDSLLSLSLSLLMAKDCLLFPCLYHSIPWMAFYFFTSL